MKKYHPIPTAKKNFPLSLMRSGWTGAAKNTSPRQGQHHARSDVRANPLAIEAFYDVVPSLDGFDVHEIALMRNGPSITFAGDLSRFADNPSPRWDASTNRVRLVLSLWTVSNLSLNGWQTTNIGKLSLLRSDNMLTFRFANADMQCSGNFEFAMIDQISGYTDAAI